jgi:uncharacterized protein YigE (DUF2233 family)
MRVTVLLLVLLAPLAGQKLVAVGEWSREEVAVGVVLRTAAITLFDLPETVSLLDVDLKKTGARLALACPGGFSSTGAIGRKLQGVAAVNGGFFDKKGRSVGVLRVAGKGFGDPHEHRTCGLVVDARGRATIETDRSYRFKGIPDVMTAGPRLLAKGKVPAHAGGWSKARHPRTAVGIRADGHVLFVTIDGRTAESKGLSLMQLAVFMKDLGCREALNLDGGGSSTMWVRGEPWKGIVNFPCDNRKHDHAGVRKVPNAVVILARDIVQGDTDEATLAPVNGWKRRTDGRGIQGPDWAASSVTSASATWNIQVDFAGRWALHLRYPRATRLTRSARVRCRSLEARVNQSTQGGDWRKLGVIEIAEPGRVEVILSSTDDRALAADAVRLVQQK